MSGATYPPRILEPIASDAGGSYITNPMPDVPTGTNAASVQAGFPPITMQPELSGGKPPLGQDMNGFLFLVSSHTFYTQCGQTYLYDATLAAAISGYAVGTILGMTDGTGLWLNTLDGNTSDPDAGGAGWVPISAYGFSTVSGLTGGTVALTAAQAKYGVIVLAGVLTSNLVVNFPQTDQQWLVVNTTTGAFTTTCKTAAGGSTGVVVPQGGFSAPTGVYSVGDGNIYPTVAPLSVPISQAATPLTLAERTNAGYLLAVYFNQSSGLENPTVGSVFVQNTAADGYLRKISLANLELQMQLANINGQLVNGQVPYAVVQQWAATFFANAALTGNPTAPTQAAGNSSTRIATTAFVNPGASRTVNGYEKRPSGIIEQWGIVANGGAGPTAVVFPIAFPNACFNVVSQNVNVQATIEQSAVTLTGFTSTNGAGGSSTYWRAIGY